jgi:hypothetical protein
VLLLLLYVSKSNFWFSNLSCSRGLIFVPSLWLAELMQPNLLAFVCDSG